MFICAHTHAHTACIFVCVTKDQGQCQAPCQTCVLLFRPQPDPCLLHWTNEHKQKTEENKGGEYEYVCVCVCCCRHGEREQKMKTEEMEADKEGRRRANRQRLRGRRGESGRKRTTTWFHPLLSHSWQRHALVTDRQITLV